MAPLPENSTNRLFLDYTSRGIGHTMMLRTPGDDTSAATYATAYASIFAISMFDDDSFYRARFSAALSDFSLPIPFTAVVGEVDAATTNSWAQDPESVQWSLVFRGNTTGRRGRVEFFTAVPVTPWPGDNRYNPGDNAVVDARRVEFTDTAEAGGELPLLTIGSDEVTVYGYVNIRSNAYWQNKQRA